jgi:hypothetical protein
MGQSSICKSYEHRTVRRKAKGASFHDLRLDYVFFRVQQSTWNKIEIHNLYVIRIKNLVLKRTQSKK